MLAQGDRHRGAVKLGAARARAVERGETRPGVDTDWIGDLLTGPLLMRALLPTGPIDANLARLTVETALEASTV